jgi:hypothetical protein
LYAPNDDHSKHAGHQFADQSITLHKHIPFFAVNCMTDGQIICDAVNVTNFPWVVYFETDKSPEPYEGNGDFGAFISKKLINQDTGGSNSAALPDTQDKQIDEANDKIEYNWHTIEPSAGAKKILHVHEVK